MRSTSQWNWHCSNPCNCKFNIRSRSFGSGFPTNGRTMPMSANSLIAYQTLRLRQGTHLRPLPVQSVLLASPNQFIVSQDTGRRLAEVVARVRRARTQELHPVRSPAGRNAHEHQTAAERIQSPAPLTALPAKSGAPRHDGHPALIRSRQPNTLPRSPSWSKLSGSVPVSSHFSERLTHARVL